MTLVYSLAFGQAYFFHMAQAMIDSLRATGYDGDCIILTDQPWEFQGATTAIIDMTPADLWKSAIRKVVRCEGYEKILFVDSDIFFVKHPADLFALDGVHAPAEPITVKASGLNRMFLTDEERAEWADKWSTNCGTFVMPGKEAAAFLTAFEAGWRKYSWGDLPDYWPENQKFKSQMSDQSALQACIVRGELPVNHLPAKAVAFPGITTVKDLDGVSLIHFCGPQQTKVNKEKILEWMKGCRTDIPAVLKSVAAESYKWNGGQAQIEVLSKSIKDLATAINILLSENDELKKRLTALESHKEYA